MTAPEKHPSHTLRTLNIAAALSFIAWTLICAGSFWYHVSDSRRHIEQIARHEAEESIDKDIFYRVWAAGHGGVYVPVTEKTPPNPYLTGIKERDITTPSGRRLTLVNPSYMTRQVHELGSALGAARGHITSARPIRPENKADEWELKALAAVQQGARDFGELLTLDGQPYYRLLKPLYVERSCLACHTEQQGYRLGDLRGGISSAVPLADLAAVKDAHLAAEQRHFGVVWAAGTVGMTIFLPYVRRRVKEREQAEARLIDSEARLRKAQEIGRIGNWEWRAEDDELWLSEEALRIFGMEAGRTVTFDNFIGCIHPEDRERVRTLTREAVDQGRMELHLEYRIILPGGEVRHLYESSQSEPDAAGAVVRRRGIVQDVTESKRAEQGLRESRAQLDLALKGAKMGVWNWDIGKDRRTFDDQVCGLLGLDPAAFSGRAEEFFGAIHPDDRGSVKAALARAAETGASYEPAYRAVWPDGSVHFITTRGMLIRDRAGRPERLMGIIWDVTEQKQRENALREIAETLSVKTGTEYFNAMTEFISKRLNMEYVLIGERHPDQHTITTISLFGKTGHAANITYPLRGTPCENVVDKSLCIYPRGVRTLFPGDAMLGELMAESYIGTPLFGRDGMLLGVIAVLGTREMDAETEERGRVLLTIMSVRAAAELERSRDEHLRKALEQQLLQSQKIESLGRLAGGIAHDINNMLTPVLGYAELMGLRLPEGDPNGADLLEIVSAASRVKEMTHQLLAFARKQTLEMRPLDVNAVILQFGRILRRTLREDIGISIKLAPAVGAVLADERQLEQVILNLAVNAQDAMPGGGVLMIATQDVDLDAGFCAARAGMAPGRHVLIRISDVGIGMDGATLSRIFDPFFTTKESGRGTGLGLATVYGIVKQHRGYIEVASEPRQGAAFSIYLPVHADDAEAPEGRQQPELQRGSETILLVEDQSEVLGIVKQLLETLGYRVLAAINSDAARAALTAESGPVELMITDVIMPRINGKELYGQLQAKRPGMKVLYMSGYPADVISTQGALDSGVVLLRKPFSIQDLSAKVRQVLDGQAG